jgi:mannan endo-1,4-beta-mannosidase
MKRDLLPPERAPGTARIGASVALASWRGWMLLLMSTQVLACSGNPTAAAITPAVPAIPPSASTFAIVGSQIQQNGRPVTLAGANALHVYGGTSDAMPSWRVTIVREFIRNLNGQPITGDAVYSTTSRAYFHSLRTVVENNRRNGLVTILCPFGWDTLEVLGLNPSEQSFYSAYKARMRAIATEFHNEPDVWLEVWNEPYWFDGGRGYTDDVWLRDMQDMVDNIRSTGNQNIVLVPGAETGQAEGVLLAKGATLLEGRSNILFDIHAYEKWLLGTSPASVAARIEAVQRAGLAMVFGEISPFNAGVPMDVRLVLDAAVPARIGALAWVWKDDASDRAALRTASGDPNDASNATWGTTFRRYLAQIAALQR